MTYTPKEATVATVTWGEGTLNEALALLADRVADEITVSVLPAMSVRMGEMADGSGRAFAIIAWNPGADGWETGTRLCTPARPSSPAWARAKHPDWQVDPIDRSHDNVHWL